MYLFIQLARLALSVQNDAQRKGVLFLPCVVCKKFVFPMILIRSVRYFLEMVGAVGLEPTTDRL